MGTNLILINKESGDYIADLGRAYQFHGNGSLDYETIENDIKEVGNRLINSINNFKSYMQGRQDILKDIANISENISEDELDIKFNDTIDDVNEYINELIILGKNSLLSYILEEVHLACKVE